MEEFKTYYDIKYESSSKIFESKLIEGMTPDQIQDAEKCYKILVEKLENKENIDEGLFSSIIGGIGGALIGPTIGKIICKVLGINEDGALGKLITSPLVCAAISATITK